MNLEELQSVQSRERQASKLQHLRASFYEDVGEYIGGLRAKRAEAAAESDNPFDDPDVEQLSDRIRTAEQTVESIYERRVGKVVKIASIAAAGMSHQEDGLTTEEERLFERLVDAIEGNRESVLSVLDGDAPGIDCTPSEEGTRTGADVTPDPGEPAGAGQATDAPEATDTRSGAGPTDTPEPAAGTGTAADAARHDPNAGTDTPNAGADTGDTGDAEGDRPAPPDRPAAEDVETTGAGSAAEPVPDEESLDIAGAMGASSDDERSTGGDGDGPVPVAGAGTEGGAGTGAEPAPRAGTGAEAGGREEPESGSGRVPDEEGPVERTTVRVTADVGDIFGVDGRSYDLSAEDVVTLPTANAENLVSREAAERLD